ncbi:hypothetical protein CH339_09760 [Rhodobium orientis]|uniref:Uncharacterized protein n=2 Tax=Rhodobium orientis TaxID=34017 RepID=A0A327JQ65_9HYPH|nr:hypothetical protein CH339_09760 [Rhodobium orientis]
MHADNKINDDGLAGERLWMFADAGLEETIKEIWPDHYEYDLRGDLIRLITLGKLRGCLELVRGLLQSPCDHHHHGQWALECLIELDDKEALAEFAGRFSHSFRDMPLAFQVSFATNLFPDYLTLDQLCDVIEFSNDPRRGTVEGFGHALKRLWRKCPEADKDAFAERLAALALRKPHCADYHRVSAKYRFIARNIRPICRDLLQKAEQDAPSQALVRCLMTLRRADRQEGMNRNEKPSIKQLIDEKPAVKRALLWHDVAEARANARYAEKIRSFRQIFFLQDEVSPSYTADDISWLLDDLSQRSCPIDRMIVLSILVDLVRSGIAPERINRPILTDLVSDDADVSDWLCALFNPPPVDKESAKWEKQAEKYRLKRRRKELIAQASWVQFRKEMVSNPELILQPSTRFRNIHQISNLLRLDANKASEEFVEHVDRIEEWFSAEVKQAFTQALSDHWRSIDVTYEGAKTWNQEYGRAGVYLEFRENLAAFDELSVELANKAIRLGVTDHHSDWVQRLIERRPDIGLPIVAEHTAGELSSSDGFGTSFLYYFAHQAPSVPSEIVDCLRDAATPLPSDENLLGLLIAIFVKAELPDAMAGVFSDLFEQAFSDAFLSTNYTRAAQCIGGLLAINTSAGISRMQPVWSDASADQKIAFATAVFGVLFDNRHGGLALNCLNKLSPSELASLYRIGRTFVPNREPEFGVARSVDEIDRAQCGHNAVLAALIEKTGADAYAEVCGLATNSEESWCLRRAKSMLERDSERAAWNEAEVLSFEQAFTAPIKNGIQLHAAVMHALQSFYDGLTNNDASICGLLQTFSQCEERDEAALRDAILSNLIDNNAQVFHSARENQVGRKKRPDIFIAGATCPFQVAIEVKQADQWSGTDLFAALEDQLVGQYLYPENRRNGVLLLINTDPKKSWELPGRKRRSTFAELMEALQVRADELSNTEGRERVSVFSIDVPI